MPPTAVAHMRNPQESAAICHPSGLARSRADGPATRSPIQGILDDVEVRSWYFLRRQTRRKRNKLAAELFSSALADLKPGDVCIDCGANVGSITRRLADTGAMVQAFEPNPAACAILKESVADRPNVFVHEAAVGSQTRRVKLYDAAAAGDAAPVSSGATTVSGKINARTQRFVMVDQIDFVSFMRDLRSPVALIKMDIEGSELDLLTALLDAGLTDRARNIFVETHEKQFPAQRKALMDLVRRCADHPNIHLDWW